MKKIIYSLLALIMLLPLTVKADIQVLHTYNNESVIVGGELDVYIPVSFDIEYNLVVEYDSSLLSIDKSGVVINHEETTKIVNDEPQKVNNLLEVEASEGKLKIKTKMNHMEGVIDDDSHAVITLKFKALKEGGTKIQIDGGYTVRFGNIPQVTIKGTNCPVSSENQTEEQPTTEQPTTESPINNTEEKSSESAKTETNKECNNNDNGLLFYFPLGLNALLIVIIILGALKKKERKERREKEKKEKEDAE